MTEVTPLSPELSRSVSMLARSLVTAARSWSLYPPDHPALLASVQKLTQIVRDTTNGQVFGFAVTPETLLVGGASAPVADRSAAEAAAWLHQRDILTLTFVGDVPAEGLHALLALLAEDVNTVRARGGPAKAWSTAGHPAIGLQQIDFSHVLDDREVENPARRKDDLWRAIVQAVTDRHKTLDEAIQGRLLEIAGDIGAIGNLAEDVMAPACAADGSPMLTSQAAAVVAAYRHLVGIVDVMAPERRTEVMQNLAAATAQLDPRVVLEMLSGPDDGPAVGGGVQVKKGLAEAFDDFKVAQLLATTLAIDGQATDRLANVFDTIAPDEPRKRRVLSLTRSLLTETSFGKTNQFQTLWTSMEELLLTYNEKPFVSAAYKAGLDHVGARAEEMASDVPAELMELVETLGQDSVRRLSVLLLIDLLTLERDPARAPELARDVAALCEDLLLAGDYEAAVMVARALAAQAADRTSVTSEGSRVALDALTQTPAFVETVALLGEMSDGEAARFGELCEHIGPAATDALRGLLDIEAETPGRTRATAIIRMYGSRAAARLAPLVSSAHWYAQRNAAEVLGELGSADGVPLLQPLLRGTDPRVIQAAVRALSSIDDPAAARAVHTVLRAAAGEQRRAVVAALVAERDPRVVPLLVRILNESAALGEDHAIVLETLAALGQIGGDQAVPHVAVVMRQRRWLAPKKVRTLKLASLNALRAVGSPAAEAAITEAATRGDRLLRKLARAAQGPPTHG